MSKTKTHSVDQDQLLIDLTRKVFDKLQVEIEATYGLAELFHIHATKVDVALSGSFFYMLMHFMHKLHPSMKPQDFADIALSQFTHFLRSEADHEPKH